MKVKRITTREQLEALPEGEWVEVEEGMEHETIDLTAKRRPARVEISVTSEQARALCPGPGEVLEASIRGRKVELVRRTSRSRKRSNG
jgi:hypothetical protein